MLLTYIHRDLSTTPVRLACTAGSGGRLVGVCASVGLAVVTGVLCVCGVGGVGFLTVGGLLCGGCVDGVGVTTCAHVGFLCGALAA